MKALEELKKKAENDLEKIANKNELTASDWDAAKKGLEVLEKISKIGAYDEYGCDDEYNMSGRRGSINYSYGMDYRMPPRPWENGTSGGNYGYGMRSDTWSGTNRGSYGRNDMYGYSGHSVKDRMVARLEGMMDEAGSDYEKKQISEWISRIERDEKK